MDKVIEFISETFDITIDEAYERIEAWINQNEYPNLFNDFISNYGDHKNEK